MVASFSKKVCLLGDFAVGKTSLVRRFVYNRFDDKYISTIGVKVSRKTVSIPHEGELVELTMMLWDLAGNEKSNNVQASYLRGSAGAIVVCDLTRPQTLDKLEVLIGDLHKVSPNSQLILAANKSDLTEQYKISATEIEQIALHFDAPFYLTSAKRGDEVDTLFRHLGRMLVT